MTKPLTTARLEERRLHLVTVVAATLPDHLVTLLRRADEVRIVCSVTGYVQWSLHETVVARDIRRLIVKGLLKGDLLDTGELRVRLTLRGRLLLRVLDGEGEGV